MELPPNTINLHNGRTSRQIFFEYKIRFGSISEFKTTSTTPLSWQWFFIMNSWKIIRLRTKCMKLL